MTRSELPAGTEGPPPGPSLLGTGETTASGNSPQRRRLQSRIILSTHDSDSTPPPMPCHPERTGPRTYQGPRRAKLFGVGSGVVSEGSAFAFLRAVPLSSRCWRRVGGDAAAEVILFGDASERPASAPVKSLTLVQQAHRSRTIAFKCFAEFAGYFFKISTIEIGKIWEPRSCLRTLSRVHLCDCLDPGS